MLQQVTSSVPNTWTRGPLEKAGKEWLSSTQSNGSQSSVAPTAAPVFFFLPTLPQKLFFDPTKSLPLSRHPVPKELSALVLVESKTRSQTTRDSLAVIPFALPRVFFSSSPLLAVPRRTLKTQISSVLLPDMSKAIFTGQRDRLRKSVRQPDLPPGVHFLFFSSAPSARTWAAP